MLQKTKRRLPYWRKDIPASVFSGGGTSTAPGISGGTPTYSNDANKEWTFAPTTTESLYAGVIITGVGTFIEVTPGTSHSIVLGLESLQPGSQYAYQVFAQPNADPEDDTGRVLGVSGTLDQPITLSNAADGTPTADGATDATVDTDCPDGTLYWAAVTNAGSATDAQIIAGSGGDIVAAGNQAVTASGTQTVSSITGLSASTAYQIKYLQRSADSIDSSQASVDLTTASASAIGLEGTPQHANSASSNSLDLPAFTTSVATRVYIVVTKNNANAITITGGGLTFSSRTSAGGTSPIEIFTAEAASPLAGVVFNLAFSSATFITADVFAIKDSGAFDANVSVPAAGTSDPLGFTTTSDIDLVIGAARGDENMGVDSPFTVISSADFQCVGWRKTSAAGAQSFSVTTGTATALVGDAVVQA